MSSFPALQERADRRPAIAELGVNVIKKHTLNCEPEGYAYDGAEKDEGERAGHAERSILALDRDAEIASRIFCRVAVLGSLPSLNWKTNRGSAANERPNCVGVRP